MSDDLKAEFNGLLKAWGQAIISNDAAEIGSHAAEDWVIVASAGIFPKADFLAAVESGALTHETFEADVSSVRRYGDTAVVVAHVTNTGTLNGAGFSSDEWATDVYVRQGDSWTCVLTQLTARDPVP